MPLCAWLRPCRRARRSTRRVEVDHGRLPTRRPPGAGSAPGHRRTPRRRQRGGAPRASRRAPPGAAVRVVRAGDERDHLAAAAEQPVEHVVGDVDEVVPRPRRSRRRSTPSTSPGSHGPAIVIACLAATVTAPWRACRAVAVISRTSWSKARPGSWTASAASPCTCAVVGITATRTSVVGLGGAGRDLRRPAPSRRRWAARRPRAAPERVDGLEQHAGRRPVARAADDDDRAGLLEELGQARPGRDRDDLATGPRRTSGPRAAATCSAKCVTRTRCGRPGLDPGLDRGADVVDVDVDVPEPVAADHDERVAEPGEGAARTGMPSSSASSRYITSYAGPSGGQVPVRRTGRDRDPVGAERAR